MTQPGNAPKARPSHLTTADEVNKVSEGLAFKDHKDRVLQRRQTLNWDAATVSFSPDHSCCWEAHAWENTLTTRGRPCLKLDAQQSTIWCFLAAVFFKTLYLPFFGLSNAWQDAGESSRPVKTLLLLTSGGQTCQHLDQRRSKGVHHVKLEQPSLNRGGVLWCYNAALTA